MNEYHRITKENALIYKISKNKRSFMPNFRLCYDGKNFNFFSNVILFCLFLFRIYFSYIIYLKIFLALNIKKIIK